MRWPYLASYKAHKAETLLEKRRSIVEAEENQVFLYQMALSLCYEETPTPELVFPEPVRHRPTPGHSLPLAGYGYQGQPQPPTVDYTPATPPKPRRAPVRTATDKGTAID